MNIELRIERLILDGLPVDGSERAEIRDAVEAELTRLLTAHASNEELRSIGAVRSINAGEVRVTQQTSAAHLGNGIAQAVHTGITNVGKANA